ncbi:MAG TPA: DMT family transporter [Gaiellaceae bacterium]|jgi:drug/metabolite transporter (DMT)-like permease|nr:DMT family transporter [Gaiellaceae bacterium]
MSPRATGIGLAFVTAVVSGVSIYVNGHAVKHFGDATAYTTAKNGVAGLLLLSLLLVPWSRPIGDSPSSGPRGRRDWLALLVVAVIGGSIPFVLFFEGLARAEATQASYIQKTLVVWVSLLAVPLLRERFRWPHAVAIALLLAGQAVLLGSAGTVGFGEGEAMIFAATLLWAGEVVFVKWMLPTLSVRVLAAARMGIGTFLLVCWLAVTGRLSDVTAFGAQEWQWVVITGLLLTAYVATWYAALAFAQAIDVTAVLTFGAVVTALLSGAADAVHVNLAGVGLIALGTLLVATMPRWRRRAVEPAQ